MDISSIAGPESLIISQQGKTKAIYEIEERGSLYHIFAAKDSNASHDFVYYKSARSLSSAVSTIEKLIALEYPDSQKFVTDLSKYENQIDPFKIQFKGEENSQSSRVTKTKPAGTQNQNDKNVEPDQINREDRAKTNDSKNNLPENLRENLIDNSPNQNNTQRADLDAPEMAGDSDTPESFGDKAEREISEFFGGGQNAANQLKGQLEDYVLEGGSPILGALGATGLGALNLAMGFAESTAIGILDTRNLGEGVKKGTWEGVKEDAGRVLNILPQGKVANVLNMALTASDLVEAAASKNTKGFAIVGGMALLGGFGGKRALGKKKNSKQKTIRKLGKPPDERWGASGSETDAGDLLEKYFFTGDWKPQQMWVYRKKTHKKGKYNPKGSTIPDWYSEKLGVFVENKNRAKGDLFLSSEILDQLGQRFGSMPVGTKNWLIVDHRGLKLSNKSAEKIIETYHKKLDEFYEKIIIITEKLIIISE